MDNHYIIFFVALQSKIDLARLVFEVSRSHTISHTQPVGFLRTSYQNVAEAAT